MWQAGWGKDLIGRKRKVNGCKGALSTQPTYILLSFDKPRRYSRPTSSDLFRFPLRENSPDFWDAYDRGENLSLQGRLFFYLELHSMMWVTSKIDWANFLWSRLLIRGWLRVHRELCTNLQGSDAKTSPQEYFHKPPVLNKRWKRHFIRAWKMWESLVRLSVTPSFSQTFE